MNNQEKNNDLNIFFQQKLKYDILTSNFNKLDKKKIKDVNDDKKYKKYKKKLNNILNFVVTDDSFELIDDNNVVMYSCKRDLKINIKDYIKKLEYKENNIKNELLLKKYNILYEYELNETRDSLENSYRVIESLEKNHNIVLKNKEKIIKLEKDEKEKLDKMYQDLKLSKLATKQELLLVEKDNIEEKKNIIKHIFDIERNIQELLKIIKSDKIYEIRETS
tara:strand:- start:3757 stop:4419 length:663 start_codon:yes stop_codon:yes gene_type:complete